MTVLASEGVLGFGPQSAKGTEASTYYRHKAVSVDFGPQQVIQQFPPEVGGGFHPTGAYKMMVFGGGRASILPRLTNVFGWLLYAACGKLSTIDDVPEAGMYRHRFTPPDNASDMPWISLRRYIPGASGTADDFGEVVKDVRVSGIRFACAPGQILGADMTFVGRDPEFAEDVGSGEAHAWTWDNTYETYDAVPMAHQGSMTLPGFSDDEEKVTGLTIDVVNQYTTPQQELIIGSPYPDDFVLLQQMLQVSWVYKWRNADLYKEIESYGQTADVGTGRIEWSPVVYSSAFDFIATSPDDIDGLSNPYKIHFYSPKITWQNNGPPRLVGGGWLSLQFVGTAQAQSTNAGYFHIDLENENSAYSWPS